MDLRVARGGRVVIKGATFQIGPGEVVAITGPSGVGKSSLLLCVAGFIEPAGGLVEVGGVDLTKLRGRRRDQARRELIGFVLQSSELVPELSLAENVALPLRLAGLGAAAALAAAQRSLDRLGVGALAGRPIAEVSGGELQRAAIARALVHEPVLVLADEPTGALDDENGDMVLDLLLDTARATGAAVMVVTHDQRLARRADRRHHVVEGALVDA